MRLALRLLLAAFVTGGALQLAGAPTAARPIPVVLDTDIGGDIDDTWALAQVLRSPELDLKLVLTETGEPRYRASVAAKFLEVAGRSDVPVGMGPATGIQADTDRNLDPWIRDYDLTKYPGKVHADGVQALIDVVMQATETVTIIAVGPTPTLAAAVRREPRLAARCRLVGMHGSFASGYGGNVPVAEWNVKADPAALRTVLGAPWQDILLTPLDTCGLVSLTGEDYRRVWSATADPVARAVIEGYCIFAPRVSWMKCDFFATRSTTLYDSVAVWLAIATDLVEIETVKFRVTDDGFTVADPAGPFQARVAMRWKDRPAFESYLSRRILGQP